MASGKSTRKKNRTRKNVKGKRPERRPLRKKGIKTNSSKKEAERI